MTTLAALDVDAHEPDRVARFWAGVLGWNLVEHASDDGVAVVPPGGAGFELRFHRSDVAKDGPNRIHFDLTSATADDMDATVARALELGGRHIDIGQTPDDGHVVLADPEGNELCVIEPGNRFLADTDVIGAVNCDGSQAVGYFWSRALGWPLVWDEGEETAIQSPKGGSKVTWSGPPLMPRTGRDRLRFALETAAGEDVAAEVDRLVGLGARVTDEAEQPAGKVAMTDPDGNEFTLSRPA